MLILRTLQAKRNFTKVNGDTVVDLIRGVISFLGVKVNQGRTYVVEDGVEMRPDLISKVFYQTTSSMCLLLKYNGISNPFSVNVGDLFKVPDDDVLNQLIKNPEDINGTADNWMNSTRKKKKQFIVKPKTKQDKARLDYLQQNAAANTIAPPNVAKDTSVKVVNGKIVFGTDVTSIKKNDCPDPISRTKLQAALLKNKIFS